MANSQMEPWNNLRADLSQGMANSQMEPWNNLWADLSQGMANSQMEPWNNPRPQIKELPLLHLLVHPKNTQISYQKKYAHKHRNMGPNCPKSIQTLWSRPKDPAM